MAQFPVTDESGTQDALNYLLSGPSGLGQNFQGFSAYTDAYLTGNYRPPFSKSTTASLYVAPISCASAVQLDDRTFQYNFSSTQASPPFDEGNNISGSGWTNTFYNGNQGVIGVIECTTTYVRFRTNNSYPGIGDDLAGGYVYLEPVGLNSTDCNAKVTVNGNTDRVFISAQLNNIISFESSTPSDFDYTVTINRYIGLPNFDPTNPEYIFVPDDTNGKNPIVSTKTYHYYGLDNSVNPLDNVETIFSTVIDKPGSGYYWYILEVAYDAISGPIQVTSSLMELRSLSAQVVKQ